MSLSEKLYNLRKSKGLSQEELAETLGVSRQAISKWENGSATPESDKLIAIATYFSVSLDELIGREDFTTQTAPTAKTEKTRPLYFVGWLLCLLGAVLLIVWGILQILAPDRAGDVAASSTVLLDGNAILFLFCVAAVAVGTILLLKDLHKK